MTTTAENRNQMVAEARQERLEVGSIAVSTWGYDQTNVDFYIVVDRKVRKDGSTWVKVQRIHAVQTPAEQFMQYTAVPFRSAVYGEVKPDTRYSPKWRKVSVFRDEESFSPESWSWAHSWNGNPVWGSSYA